MTEKTNKQKEKLARTNSCLSWISKGLNYLSVVAIVADFIVRCVAFGRKKDKSGTINPAPTDPFYYLLTFYLLFFAALVLIAELEWRPVLKYVLFLKS